MLRRNMLVPEKQLPETCSGNAAPQSKEAGWLLLPHTGGAAMPGWRDLWAGSLSTPQDQTSLSVWLSWPGRLSQRMWRDALCLVPFWDEMMSHHHQLRQPVKFLSHTYLSNPAHQGPEKLSVEGTAWSPTSRWWFSLALRGGHSPTNWYFLGHGQVNL